LKPAAPGWARLTARDLGRLPRASRGWKRGRKVKFSPAIPLAEGFAEFAKTFGKPRPGGRGKKRQIEKDTDREPAMMRFVDRHPTASLWLIAIAQGLAMLGLNVALRALVL
jgi:hypothetical protein